MKKHLLLSLIVSAFFASAFACGGKDDVELTNDGGPGTGADADPNAPDADPTAPDAMPGSTIDAGPLGCTAGASQCNNCVDDDSDGTIDGDDPECTSLDDDDEGSFATGIPGDNMDAITQDCFFDGDSGSGNDGCSAHVCCFLEPFVDCCEGNQTAADGCLELTGPKYDPAECQPTQECIDNCGGLTPPGCDCFGCCTVCVGDNCVDVLTNPGVYDQPTCDGLANPTQGECCDSENLDACYSCTKSTDCNGGECNDDPTDCILCPGQTEADLPAECNDTQACPTGVTACQINENCGADQYCNNGCCVDAIIIN